MTLDTSVMNVAIATVAEDVGTDVTGIQTAITLYTLVMATLMITGGKLGALLGRKRAFSIGCVIYGSGSLVTAIAPSLPVLLLGWSLLEGVATRYGVIGAVFAMSSALFCVMVILVGAAVAGREIDDELDRIRRGERPAEDEVRRQWNELTAQARSRWETLRPQLQRRPHGRERR